MSYVFQLMFLTALRIRTGFLVGPIRQLKSMFDPTRMITTIVFLVAMALTLTAALWVRAHTCPLFCLLFSPLSISVEKRGPCDPFCDHSVVGSHLVLSQLHPVCSHLGHELRQGTCVIELL
jgi:hypothetical protein